MSSQNRRGLKLRIARRSRHVWLSRSLWNRRLVFIVGSVAAALAAVGFALAATWVLEMLGRVLHGRPWAAFLLAPAGLALVSWLSRRYFRGAEGSGIPQTIAALAYPDPRLRDRLLSMKVAVGKIFLTLLGLASGA
jgi:H+/Cl- antiporter ClcA